MQVGPGVVSILALKERKGCDSAEEGFSAGVTDDIKLVILVVAIGLAIGFCLVGVAVADEVLESFEEVAKEVLVDKVCVLGEALEHRTHEMRRAGLEDPEVCGKHHLQDLGLRLLPLLVAHAGVGVSHNLLRLLLLLQELPFPFRPELLLCLWLLAVWQLARTADLVV